MTQLAMLQAALFQLRGAIDAIEDPFLRSQIRLGTDMLDRKSVV